MLDRKNADWLNHFVVIVKNSNKHITWELRKSHPRPKQRSQKTQSFKAHTGTLLNAFVIHFQHCPMQFPLQLIHYYLCFFTLMFYYIYILYYSYSYSDTFSNIHAHTFEFKKEIKKISYWIWSTPIIQYHRLLPLPPACFNSSFHSFT